MFGFSSQGIAIFILGLALVTVAISIFSLKLVFKYQQKQYNNQQKIESLKIEYENSLLKSQIEIQEQTFQNISREIHDNIGQKLTLIKLVLNTISNEANEKIKARVSDSINILSDIIVDVSNINKSMSSVIILNNGLIKALEAEIIQLQKLKTCEVLFSVSGDTVFLDSDKELIVFRIIQEALNNILKHARATIINLDLLYTDKTLNLKISDNGIGFDKNKKTGTGLYNMENRTILLNGIFYIESIRRRGTTIKIEIPYK